MSAAATQVRWSAIREYSESSVRRYRQRGVISIPMSFSTASQYAKLLINAEQ
jgi:hypothetical protein